MIRIEFLTVGSKVIYEIQIVSPEVYASEWGPRRDRKAGGSATSQRRIEIRGYGQGAGEGIV
jgi:hypothetical protein